MSRDSPQVKLQRWLENHHPVAGPVAVMLVRLAAEWQDYLRVRELVLVKWLPEDVQPEKDPFKLYRDHRLMGDAVTGIVFGEPFGYDVVDAFRAFSALPKDEQLQALQALPPDECAAAVREGQRLGNAWRHSLQTGAMGDPQAPPEVEPHWREIVKSEPIRFFLTIGFPYFMQYGRSPQRDYKAARKGNAQAIRQLLLFDRRLMQDLLIGAHFSRAQIKNDWNLLRAFRLGMQGSPARMAPKQIKLRCCGLIRLLFRQSGTTIEAPDIMRLFDIIAQEGGERTDIDLPESPEALLKATQRYETTWELK